MNRGAAARLAEGLTLAAAPVFAAMALMAATERDPLALLCGAGGATGLGGMTTMYLLMSVVHAAPWLRRLTGQRERSGAG